MAVSSLVSPSEDNAFPYESWPVQPGASMPSLGLQFLVYKMEFLGKIIYPNFGMIFKKEFWVKYIRGP